MRHYCIKSSAETFGVGVIWNCVESEKTVLFHLNVCSSDLILGIAVDISVNPWILFFNKMQMPSTCKYI